MTILAAANPGMGLVIGMGLGTVFVGLISIILICYLLGYIIKVVESRKPAPAPAPAASVAPAAPVSETVENKGELIAVISAVIAEELGESVEAIRIKSIRKVS